MGCMGCPILGWDVWDVPSWDGMQNPKPFILGWDVNNLILGWDVNNPILGWDVWDIPSLDGMQ